MIWAVLYSILGRNIGIWNSDDCAVIYQCCGSWSCCCLLFYNDHDTQSSLMRCLCCLMMSRLTYTTAPSSAFPLPPDCGAWCVSMCGTMPSSFAVALPWLLSVGIYYKKHPLNWRWKVVFHEFVDSNIDRELHQVSVNFSQLLDAQSIWSSIFHKGITETINPPLPSTIISLPTTANVAEWLDWRLK